MNLKLKYTLKKEKRKKNIPICDYISHKANNKRIDDKMNLDQKKKEANMKKAEGNIKRAKCIGHPFTMTILSNGKVEIVLNAISCPDGAVLLKQQGINICRKTISNYLNGKYKKDYMQSKKTQQRKVIFKYTDEFFEDQKDLPGEIWRTEDEWDRAKDIIEHFKNRNNVLPPKAISNFGRIKTNMGKVMFVSYNSKSNGIHTYNNVRVRLLVGLAFNDYLENDPNRQGYTPEKPFARHLTDNELIKNGIDVKKKYRIDKERRRVHSNHIDTLEFCNIPSTIQYYSNEIQNAQQDPMNEFRVTPLYKDRKEIPGTFHSVPEFINCVKEKKIDITFNSGHIHGVLKGENTHHRHYKFTYVIPRVETQ